MNPRTYALATFRSLAVIFAATDNAPAAATMNFIANGIKSGADMDGHMRTVANKMEAGPLTEDDWVELHNAVNAEGDQLQARVVEDAENGGPDPVEGFTGKSGKLDPPGGDPAKQTPEPDPTVDDATNPDAPPAQTPEPDPTAAPAPAPVDPEADPNTTNTSTEEPAPTEPVSTGMQDDLDEDDDKRPVPAAKHEPGHEDDDDDKRPVPAAKHEPGHEDDDDERNTPA